MITMWGFAVFLGWYFGIFCGVYIAQKYAYSPEMRIVQRLKNALLTLALSKVYKNRFSETNYDYSTYDGTELPLLSKYNVPNTYFTYIMDRNELRNHRFYTKDQEYKLNAVELFLEQNLGTEKDSFEFFEKYRSMTDTGSSIDDLD